MILQTTIKKILKLLINSKISQNNGTNLSKSLFKTFKNRQK